MATASDTFNKLFNELNKQQKQTIQTNAYINRGLAYTNSIGWTPNTNLALFHNADYTDPLDKSIEFTLSSYAWYPEIYDQDILAKDTAYKIAHKITAIGKANNNIDFIRTPRDALFIRTPTIILRAFKPNLTELSTLITLFTTLVKMFEIFFEDPTIANDAFGRIFDIDVLNNALSESLRKSSFSNEKNKDYSFLYNGVNAMYRRLVTGVYMSTYTMPFYNNNIYLEGSSGRWESEGLFGNNSSGIASLLKKLSSFLGQMDITSRAVWESSDKSGYSTISYDFNLFNRTSKDFYKNIRFLHTLIPESLWVQHGIFQTPGTLYDVEIPGRTRFYWCTADFKCEYQGKTRYYSMFDRNELYNTPMISPKRDVAEKYLKQREDNWVYWRDARAPLTEAENSIAEIESLLAQPNNSPATIAKLKARLRDAKNEEKKARKQFEEYERREAYDNELYNKIKDKTITNYPNIYKYTELNIRDLNYIPDSYKLSIKLNPLLPNNLNTYLYGMFETNNFVPSFGEGIGPLLHSLVRNFVYAALKGGLTEAKTFADARVAKNPDNEEYKSVSNRVQKALDGLDSAFGK